jgi:putative transposase
LLPGYPQHLIQRGHHQERILYEEDDYWFLWEKIGAAAKKFRCDLHAYVLMPNHIHLLLTPKIENGVGKLMQYVGRYYVQHFNAQHGRTGTLWEGRYRATLIDPKAHLLELSHYIEANPVRAGLVEQVGDYAWSSYGANALGEDDSLVTPHPEYLRLGRSTKARRAAYRAEAERGLDAAVLQQIRDSTNKAWVLGDPQFCEEIEPLLNRRALPRQRGGDRRSAAFRSMAGRTA